MIFCSFYLSKHANQPSILYAITTWHINVILELYSLLNPCYRLSAMFKNATEIMLDIQLVKGEKGSYADAGAD